MSFARNLMRELVDKRLWPVALLMVVAIVAIPVLLGGGGSADAPLPAALAQDAVDRVKPVDVALVGPATVRTRAGKTRDPFRQPPVPKVKSAEADAEAQAPAASTGGESAPATSGGGDTKSGGGDTKSGGGDTTTVPRPAPVDTTAERTIYKVSLSWSQGEDATARRVSRLTPLVGVGEPAALYLGVSSDRYATFLLGAQSTSQGEAECADQGECRVIGLRSGETQIVEVARDGAEPVQYQLQVESIERDVLGSLTVARRYRDHEHPDGRDVLRGLIHDRRTAEGIVKFSYDRDRGLLHRAKTT